MLGVDVGGVVNGIRAFVPVMLEQDRGHLVTTASVFGIFAGTLGAYGPSRHAAVALSESVSLALREAGAQVGVGALPERGHDADPRVRAQPPVGCGGDLPAPPID